MNSLTNCTLCPRNCKADRTAGHTGFCGQTNKIMVSRAALHFWEEPCISGENGSGTVFFSGCPLRCVFCQNQDIASGRIGKEISVERLSEIFLELQEKHAHNINLVTPTHFVPPIVKALEQAKNQGLHIPVVYNTGSYEHISTLQMLDGLIDIYLPDLKYVSSELSSRYSHAADYFIRASAAIREMVRQTGKPVFTNGSRTAISYELDDRTPLMQKGVIVRHLALPGCTEDSKAVIRYLYETYGNHIFISIMNQYTPLPHAADYPELMQKLSTEEYESILDFAIALGVENGFLQEGETAEESFIPAFDYEGV